MASWKDEILRLAALTLAEVEELPLDERDAAWSRFSKGDAVRDLAQHTRFHRSWMRAPSNATVRLDYLARHPAPTKQQMAAGVYYTLDVPNGTLILQLAGVKGGDESRFRVSSLLRGWGSGTELYFVRTKKTYVPGGGSASGAGVASAAGTARARVFGPPVGAKAVLLASEGDDRTVRILDYNLVHGVLWARPA